MIPKISKIILVFLLILLVFSVFKNIGYPIIWGDEADTVMYAERILDYGYPKVHDGVNSLNYNMISGRVGVNEEYDAWTVTMWGQYYFTSIGARLARNVEDIYTKTLLLRFPHGLIGLIGILSIPFIVTPSIKNKDKRIFACPCPRGPSPAACTSHTQHSQENPASPSRCSDRCGPRPSRCRRFGLCTTSP